MHFSSILATLRHETLRVYVIKVFLARSKTLSSMVGMTCAFAFCEIHDGIAFKKLAPKLGDKLKKQEVHLPSLTINFLVIILSPLISRDKTSSDKMCLACELG